MSFQEHGLELLEGMSVFVQDLSVCVCVCVVGGRGARVDKITCDESKEQFSDVT